MPLTVDATARYNISNITGAALAAVALGISRKAISSVLERFGAAPTDNAGRLMRYSYRGAQVLVDYAHNPEGLSGLLEVGARLRKSGRLALLLGQAGNRTNADIERLAITAVGAQPDFIVIKETENYLRGRAPGEVPAIIHAALRKAGLPELAIQKRDTELAAVSCALDWARPGDVVVLPVHDRKARAEVMKLLTGEK
jgi:UDP-N-acetylmuramyl tripeptide synthase